MRMSSVYEDVFKNDSECFVCKRPASPNRQLELPFRLCQTTNATRLAQPVTPASLQPVRGVANTPLRTGRGHHRDRIDLELPRVRAEVARV